MSTCSKPFISATVNGHSQTQDSGSKYPHIKNHQSVISTRPDLTVTGDGFDAIERKQILVASLAPRGCWHAPKTTRKAPTNAILAFARGYFLPFIHAGVVRRMLWNTVWCSCRRASEVMRLWRGRRSVPENGRPVVGDLGLCFGKWGISEVICREGGKGVVNKVVGVNA